RADAERAARAAEEDLVARGFSRALSAPDSDMKPLDWRFLTPGEAAGLLDAEAARWLWALHWDTRVSHKRIESARRAGTLPGLVVRDEHGAVRGWTFFLIHDGVLQIGAFVADSI